MCVLDFVLHCSISRPPEKDALTALQDAHQKCVLPHNLLISLSVGHIRTQDAYIKRYVVSGCIGIYTRNIYGNTGVIGNSVLCVLCVLCVLTLPRTPQETPPARAPVLAPRPRTPRRPHDPDQHRHPTRACRPATKP